MPKDNTKNGHDYHLQIFGVITYKRANHRVKLEPRVGKNMKQIILSFNSETNKDCPKVEMQPVSWSKLLPISGSIQVEARY